MATSVESDLAVLSGVRIFFGHQSVGDNILQGVVELLVHQPGAMTIETLTGTPSPSARAGMAARAARSATHEPAALIHAKIGRNEDPSSKCDDFRRIIDQELAGPVDVALLKFCYIDIHPGTDVEALATTYGSCLDGLAQRHPKTVFLPVTVPLRQTPSGPGVWARQLLGRTDQTKVANARRYAFNQQLRMRYAGQPMFDLAATEATRANGSRETFALAGATGESLRAAYTDDGGHLNAAGRSAAAIELLHALASAVRMAHPG
jgi:hypothetical protein